MLTMTRSQSRFYSLDINCEVLNREGNLRLLFSLSAVGLWHWRKLVNPGYLKVMRWDIDHPSGIRYRRATTYPANHGAWSLEETNPTKCDCQPGCVKWNPTGLWYPFQTLWLPFSITGELLDILKGTWRNGDPRAAVDWLCDQDTTGTLQPYLNMEETGYPWEKMTPETLVHTTDTGIGGGGEKL